MLGTAGLYLNVFFFSLALYINHHQLEINRDYKKLKVLGRSVLAWPVSTHEPKESKKVPASSVCVNSFQKQCRWAIPVWSLLPGATGLCIEIQSAESNVSPQNICWREMKSLETLRSQDGWIFFSICQLCTEKPRIELTMRRRKASGRSFQTGKEINEEQNAEERTGHMTRANHFLTICEMRGLTKIDAV